MLLYFGEYNGMFGCFLCLKCRGEKAKIRFIYGGNLFVEYLNFICVFFL